MSTMTIKETAEFGGALTTSRTIKLSAANDVYVIYGTVGGSGNDEDHFLIDSSLTATSCAMAVTHVAPDFGATFRVVNGDSKLIQISYGQRFKTDTPRTLHLR